MRLVTLRSPHPLRIKAIVILFVVYVKQFGLSQDLSPIRLP